MSSDRIRHKDARYYVVQALLSVASGHPEWHDCARTYINGWQELREFPGATRHTGLDFARERMIVDSPTAAKALWDFICAREHHHPLRIIQRMETVTEVTMFGKEVTHD